MANGATTPSRLGQAQATGDALALFYKIFSGEVLTEFQTRTVMMGRHRVRTIESGKSAGFNRIGNAAAKYMVVGEDLADAGNTYLNAVKHAEIVINVDELLVAPTFIASIDEAMNHYDVRSPYTIELGRALAYQFDKNVLQTAVLASRASAIITGGKTGGSVGGTADVTTNANDALVQAILDGAQKLDENDIPEEGRFCVVRPAQYWDLIKSDKAINRDFDGAGSISKGKIWSIGGIDIVKSNHLPITNLGTTEDTGARNNYKDNFSTTVGLIMHPEAVGTVKLLDVQTEGEYLITRQGYFIVSKYSMGHGILRPEAAIEIVNA